MTNSHPKTLDTVVEPVEASYEFRETIHAEWKAVRGPVAASSLEKMLADRRQPSHRQLFRNVRVL